MLTPLITKMATAAPSPSRADARVTLRRGSCHVRLTVVPSERSISTGLGRPVEGLVLTPLQGRGPCRGAASGGASSGLRCPLQPSRGSLQAFCSVLSRFIDSVACEGCGEWALHTLDPTGPTQALRPWTESMDNPAAVHPAPPFRRHVGTLPPRRTQG